MLTRTWWKIFVAFIVVGGIIWVNQHIHMKPQTIRAWILSFGVLAPLVFIGLYTVRPFLFFPASILSLAAGLAFGAWWGTIFTVIGATLGASLSFLVAKKFGERVIHESWKKKTIKLQAQLKKNGFMYVLLLRLIPIFPFDFISYLAGIVNVKFTHFLFATWIGIIPGTFAYNFLGSSFASGNRIIIIIAIIVFLIISFVPIMTNAKLRQKLGLQQKGE
ncbi:putative membrane protein YdjX (TVP38/TMEM64 family) [Anoxybacillus voinovskiensis]|uniref:TVP38/TMEM64 family membrane protein n=1 Tax=Anoxybacteroides voinovskiense TaxID=230470 RepID=A0A840DVJ9_9BACL|nr:TVP38/TMEM64 family protein [Anoxybacillus voinovskiensis]MBB4075703.1 putative membrane protein YdjX (TVP38/TMEM64 family) [Anoxybacillus voinovskiensis]GGJ81400.1 TVP38/TMEM64 family membrane protein YtxB [Anoxybacillus voinovskiensis]